MKTYDQIHAGLHYFRGRASTHSCISCGKSASQWSYQHTGEAVRDADGYTYCLDLAQYAPMCRSCHRSLDLQHSELMQDAARKGVEAMQTALKELRQTDEYKEGERERGKKYGPAGAAARTARMLNDPEFRAQIVEGCVERGSRRRRCVVCDMTSHPVDIGKHQKASGHTGYVDL